MKADRPMVAPGEQPLALYTDPQGADVRRARALLEEGGMRVVVEELGSERELLRCVRSLRPQALLVSYLPVSEAVLAAAPSVRIVSCGAAGFDNVDVAAADRHGVWVANVPDAATEEVASHALAMALALLRGLPALHRHVRDGGWDYAAAGIPPRLSETTLGIVGLGRIGARLAALAGGIFGRVIGCDPLLDPGRWPAGVVRAELDECLRASGVVSLHLPLSARTERIIDARALALMPPGAHLVNVSRGALIDQQALLAALDSGRLGGAALDVTDPEPPAPDSPLRSHPRILITPHAAFLSAAALDAYPIRQAENVLAWRRTGRPRTPVNDPAHRP